jgi:phosphate transport system substrate-binding protein
MPKSGTFARITFVLAIAAGLAALAVGSAGAAPAKRDAATITGAGSTFVAPLIAQWVPAVAEAYGYTLSPDQFTACNGCIQIPWALAATSVFYNMPGVKNLLHMDGPTLAKIFMGQITKWNDPAIAKLNPGVSLPDQSISIAHRSDGSGTTYNFTDYLSHVSAAWKNQIGLGTSVNWPVGSGGKGSSGVAGIVSQTPGAIGYADVAYALSNHLKYFAMKNKSGKFTVPALRGILAAALLDTKPAADGSLSIVNPPKAKKYANAYPISTYTYVIVPLQTAKAHELKQLISWAVTHGQSYGPKLIFQPLPLPVVKFDEKAIAKIHS